MPYLTCPRQFALLRCPGVVLCRLRQATHRAGAAETRSKPKVDHVRAVPDTTRVELLNALIRLAPDARP